MEIISIAKPLVSLLAATLVPIFIVISIRAHNKKNDDPVYYLLFAIIMLLMSK